MKRRILLFGIASIGATALSAVVAVLVAAFVLLGDVGALQKEARNATRTAKALQTDIDALKDRLAFAPAVVEALPRPVVSAATPVDPIAATTAASARVVKVGTATSSGCVFRPGDVEGLADCIRSYKWPNAERATFRYR